MRPEQEILARQVSKIQNFKTSIDKASKDKKDRGGGGR